MTKSFLISAKDANQMPKRHWLCHKWHVRSCFWVNSCLALLGLEQERPQWPPCHRGVCGVSGSLRCCFHLSSPYTVHKKVTAPFMSQLDTFSSGYWWGFLNKNWSIRESGGKTKPLSVSVLFLSELFFQPTNCIRARLEDKCQKPWSPATGEGKV